MNQIRIVSNGKANQTRVFAGEMELRDITEVKIKPITANGWLVEASITFIDVKLDITAKLPEGAEEQSW